MEKTRRLKRVGVVGMGGYACVFCQNAAMSEELRGAHTSQSATWILKQPTRWEWKTMKPAKDLNVRKQARIKENPQKLSSSKQFDILLLNFTTQVFPQQANIYRAWNQCLQNVISTT